MTQPELWNKSPEPELPIGPLANGYACIWQNFNKSGLEKTKIDGEVAWKTEVYLTEKGYLVDGDSRYKSAEAVAYRTKKSTDLLLAIQRSDSDFVDRYSIKSDGMIAKIENRDWSFDSEQPDSIFIINTLHDLGIHLQKAAETRKIKRQENAKRNRNRTLAAVAGVTLVGIAGGLVKYYGFDVPAEEARRAEIFDSKHLVLGGDELKIAMGRTATLPSSEFDEIPPFKAGDTLISPRVIELIASTDQVTCVAVDYVPEPGQKFVLATMEDTPESASLVGVSVHSNGKLGVCATKDFAEENKPKIAIQTIE